MNIQSLGEHSIQEDILDIQLMNLLMFAMVRSNLIVAGLAIGENVSK